MYEQGFAKPELHFLLKLVENISLKTKLRLIATNVKIVLLYGSETLRVTKDITDRVQIFANRCLRSILDIRWLGIISNEDLWKRTNQDKMQQTNKKEEMEMDW